MLVYMFGVKKYTGSSFETPIINTFFSVKLLIYDTINCGTFLL